MQITESCLVDRDGRTFRVLGETPNMDGLVDLVEINTDQPLKVAMFAADVEAAAYPALDAPPVEIPRVA